MSTRAMPVYGDAEDDVIDRSGATIGQFVNALQGNDTVIGSDFNDRLYLGSGDDTAEGGGGNDTIVGGDGDDTARYRGSIFDYDWSEIRPEIWQVFDTNASDGDEGTDTLRGVEYLQFDDFVFNVGGDNAPLIIADDHTMNEDEVFSFSVQGYDFDGGNATLVTIGFTGFPDVPDILLTPDPFFGTPIFSGMGVGNEHTISIDPTNTNYLQALGVGEVSLFEMSVVFSDGQGNQSTKDILITIEGRNDDPTISGVTYNQSSVQEDGSLTATGVVNASDVDQNDVLSYSVQGGGAGTYGSLSINANGEWTYSLNNGSSAVQNLNTGDTVQDTFTIEVSDDYGGVATQDITIDVLGQDEPGIWDGIQLSFQDLFPTKTSPLSSSHNGVFNVGSGVEITGYPDSTPGVDIDFREDGVMEILFTENIAFGSADFNGFSVTDVFDLLPDFSGYFASTDTGASLPDVTWEDDVFYVDLQGAYTAGQMIEVGTLYV